MIKLLLQQQQCRMMMFDRKHEMKNKLVREIATSLNSFACSDNEKTKLSLKKWCFNKTPENGKKIEKPTEFLKSPVVIY